MPDFEQEEFAFPDEAPAKVEVKAKDAGDDFEFIIEDDTPPEDRGQKPMPEEIVKKLEVADEDSEELDLKAQKERLKQYKKVWNDERRAKEAALREQQEALALAQRFVEENKRLKEVLKNGSEELVESNKSAAKMAVQEAKRAYKDAVESGDADRMAEAQSELMQAQIKLDNANKFRPNISLQSEEFEVQSPQVEQQRPKVDPKTQAWLDENPWYGSKKAMSNFAVGIHEELIDEYGTNVVGTDQYFKHIDKTMRKKFPEYFETLEGSQAEPEKEPQTAPAKAKPSTVVAPATRSTSSKQVRLKQTQMALIKKLGLTPEVYAREQQKLEASNG
jgi:hypothetical protein